MRFNKKKTILISGFLFLLVLLLNERNNVLSTPSNISLEQLGVSDCGVVLTGYPGRLREAFEVFSKGKVNKLIVSGVYKNTQMKDIFPQISSLSQDRADDIILEKISGTTQQNAVQSLQIVQVLRCQNIVLMTSTVHMYRALKTFKLVFPENFDIRTYPISNPNKEITEYEVLYEAMKSLFYSVMFLINIESF